MAEGLRCREPSHAKGRARTIRARRIICVLRWRRWAVLAVECDGNRYVKEFGAFKGSGCINVYNSDGTTVIGKFSIGTVICDIDSATPGDRPDK